ncbi:hypothetical protein CDAR_236851 [Caerostris darwini]|uniref:Uncharacterized protein n=1 Tax=Caerostris darwini TaxID=1538125 RepID=A0AAV4S242_9ARAC|nr:hypothetical protein CDAR_236851 [Caerostris darwini]
MISALEGFNREEDSPAFRNGKSVPRPGDPLTSEASCSASSFLRSLADAGQLAGCTCTFLQFWGPSP